MPTATNNRNKLSIKECRKILGKNANYTDEQIEKIRDFLYVLGEIQLRHAMANSNCTLTDQSF
jgi:hypothetical protein